jgi:hypothetical protein
MVPGVIGCLQVRGFSYSLQPHLPTRHGLHLLTFSGISFLIFDHINPLLVRRFSVSLCQYSESHWLENEQFSEFCGSCIVNPSLVEPQGAETFGRSPSQYTEVSAPALAPGSESN